MSIELPEAKNDYSLADDVVAKAKTIVSMENDAKKSHV